MKLGIDLGGSHVGIGLISEDFKLFQTKHINFENQEEAADMKKIQKILQENIEALLKEYDVKKEEIELIGVAAPGVPKEDKIERLVNLKKENISIRELLPKFKDKKIILNNDGKCAAMAEKKKGCLQKEKDCIFLCLGTGIGAGVFLDGKLLKPTRVPGFEVGHMIIKDEGIRCKCGNRGCFETYASMRKFKSDLSAMLNISPNLSGEELKEILTNFKDNMLVKQVIDQYLNDITVGIINLVNLFAPEAICFGGSFAYFQEFFLEPLQTKVNDATYLANDIVPTLKVARLKNDAGILGSILLED